MRTRTEDHDDVACCEEQDGNDDDDDFRVSVMPKPGEASSSDIEAYGPYWIDSSDSIPYVDHLSDYISYTCALPGSFCLVFFSFQASA